MDSAYDIVRRFEGCRLEAYKDVGGIWTIGWGHTRTAGPGRIIDQAEAERLLDDDLRIARAAVDKHVPVPLTVSQREALTSFVFNVGAGNLATSTLRAHLLAGQPELAAREFGRWIWAGGKPLRGLILRRAAETALYASEPFGASAVV